jgi:hypothetical protein
LQSLGAMLAPIRFRLSDGRTVQPMQIAPFGDRPGAETLPGVLRGLRGEWPCVPFGMTPQSPLPAGWPQDLTPAPDEQPHGFGSNNDWEMTQAGDGALVARIACPAPDPVAELTRRVSGATGEARVDISLEVRVRRDCRLPIGLHPTFRLPETPGLARIDPGRHDAVWTYPLDTSPTRQLFAPNARGESLQAVPSADGGFRDLSRVPFAESCENILLLSGAEGRCALENIAENYRVIVTWNAAHFPSLALWMSNRGRAFAPWNGEHLALGIEPVCAPFDLGPACAAHETPLSRAGVATSIALRADTPFTTNYAISVEPMFRIG